MLIAVDGACKRNGKPDCLSSGVAFIKTDDGNIYYKARVEQESTNQRGEINGLLLALNAAMTVNVHEDIYIITDSEYLHNTVEFGWVDKWAANNWIGSAGVTVKNYDLWKTIYGLLRQLNVDKQRVFMQWTKGHLLPYTPTNIKNALVADPTGVELFNRITVIANRPSEKARIIKDFNYNRVTHDKSEFPDELALETVIINTVADCLASYVVAAADAVYK